MKSRLPRVLALSPSGLRDPGIVVAASRAGALGIFDFGFAFEVEAEKDALRRASKFLKGRAFGIRVPAQALVESVLAELPENVTVVVTAGGVGGREAEEWARVGRLLRSVGRPGVAEVVSRAGCRAAVEAGFSALIAAGNEAGGWASEESSFILLQALLAYDVPPIWVRGGVGPRSASACVAAGAAGVVLDGALLLAKESTLGSAVRQRIERWDGSESCLVGREFGARLRVQADPGSVGLAAVRQAGDGPTWDEAVRRGVGWGDGQARPVGQDAALAAGLAKAHVTVGGIVQAVERAIDQGLVDARVARPLAEGSPLAQSHGTRYPVVQGPMTRVSDLASFAGAVAEGGGLPFLALALMRGPEIGRLLTETAERLHGRPWGVGVLGFVPPELRQEQIEQVRRVRPAFALIAGGRPDQAQELERDGIATYLHAPSPGLLRQYWNDGARRFVLEGRECGGHVGPRSSFLLWEQAVEVVLEMLQRGGAAEDVHLLFAGGIHDARSASAVAALAGPLARRGVRVGVLVGTAYLFTQEAVATGAIVAGFQDQAVRCTETVLLETGPGHEIRVSPSPYVDSFELERSRLLAEGRSAEAVRDALEALNAGRLRIAAKGIERKNGAGSPLVGVAAEGQMSRGLYMLGQAATLRDGVSTIAELHLEISEGATERIESLADELEGEERETAGPLLPPSDIAIVGMSAIVPGAADVRSFWENTLHGRDAITEVPPDRWDWRLYYDADPKAPDKITSKWGGFVPEIPFDPLRYGMPPTSLPSIEPLHLLTLEAVRAAIDDAGYRDRAFPRERTAVVLGAGGGAAQLAMGYAFRSYLPMLDTVAPGAGRTALEQSGAFLPEWTEDSFPGILLNVAAGRVANRFDLGGANYTVDAACGSSLAAASVAIRELESGAADLVILGGADTVQNPFTYLAFSKTQAFSPRGRCRPFDASADGIVISEAVAVVVLKRLADAERDGDRIYAVIKGLGASSDGRAKGLTAPRPEGQVRALRRAYDRARIDPASVGYVEAHGTGTAAGDKAEVNALIDVFNEAGAETRQCALGSVKSLVGHTKCAAGLVGLINASLALHHGVLPPTIGVAQPSEQASRPDSPFHISTKTRPWIHASADQPRRAGVSAFGFGGTNFHAVLEAYEGVSQADAAPLREWPAELFVWRTADRVQLLTELERLGQAFDRGARPRLRDLAHSLVNRLAPTGASLAIVADSLEDLRAKLVQTQSTLASSVGEFHDPRGISFNESVSGESPRVAYLFPGQGAQRVEMLNELSVAFTEVRSGFESVDRTLRGWGWPGVARFVFAEPARDADERARQNRALAETEVAQPALGAASLGLLRLLESFDLSPDLVAGHSYGELVALHAAGVFSVDALIELSVARGQLIKAAAGDEPGAMAALSASLAQTERLLDGLDGVAAVNWNGPKQTVISGRRDAVQAALARARQAGVRGQELAVSCAFHSPLVADASQPLAALAGALGPRRPVRPVFSNVTGGQAATDPASIAEQVGAHPASPVRFAPMIEAMHDAGARVFVEVGPGSTLTSLVGSILADRPHLAVACDPTGRPGIPGLLQTLGRLFTAGVPVRLERLTAGRTTTVLDPATLADPASEDVGPTTWLVNGTRARPVNSPEPKRLGPGPALPIPAPQPPRAGSPPLRSTPPPSASTTPMKDHDHAMSVSRPPEPAHDQGRERVLEAFQKTMQMFLDVQRETMLGYLGATRGGAAPNGSTVPAYRPEPPPSRVSASDATNPEPPSAKSVAPAPPTQTRPVAQAAAPVAPPPPLVEAVAPSAPETFDVAARLLAIVRDRTGYPAEMLRLDLDLEADLGIDSIKRVEILGTLRDSLPKSALGSTSDMMDQLARARTLGAIVEKVELGLKGPASTARPNAVAAVAPSPRSPVSNGHAPVSAPRPELGASPVRRQLLQAVATPLPRNSEPNLGLAPSGLLLLTDDGRGVARALAKELGSQRPVVLVRHSYTAVPDESDLEGDVQTIDLTSPSAVAGLVARLRRRGPLVGIIHALPFQNRPAAGLDRQQWSARLGPEARGLFLLAQAAAGDLARAAEKGGACLIACTALGGGLASVGEIPDQVFPGQGAVAGIIKTVAREWPSDVRVRVVDFSPDAEVASVVASLLSELGGCDGRTEVGYHQGSRITLRVAGAPLSTGRVQLELSPGDPILVTGGARGITAVTAAEIARTWKPTFLLAGTSPLPPEVEDSATAGVTNPAALKARLHQRLAEQSRREVGPVDLERAYQTVRRQREIRANLERLRASGARVDYAQVDVRDADALAQVLARWRSRYGPVKGLIHGAGVIQDKLLRDKSLESFDRVVGTKIDGALNLAALLDPASLRFAAFFSSVAGRFGNRGQVDYAAANETLNKLALWLDRRWPGRVVSVIWGPWSGVGMVSDLEAHLQGQGLGMISPVEDARRLIDELRFGRKGDVEVIVAGEIGSLLDPDERQALRPAAPQHQATLVMS